jgi:hypothetical protein
MNGSLYAVLLYLVIYLQDILGYSSPRWRPGPGSSASPTG